jgi:hypothetical protein
MTDASSHLQAEIDKAMIARKAEFIFYAAIQEAQQQGLTAGPPSLNRRFGTLLPGRGNPKLAYVQYGQITEAERAEQQRQRQLDEWLKELESTQALIRIKLSIALRSGLDRDLREQIEEAAASYGEAFNRLMAACPARQILVGKRRGC